MANGKKSHKGLKICCGVTAVIFVIISVVLIVLALTMFKPKEPEVIVHPVSLDEIQFAVFPKLKLNVKLGLMLTINNRNYGSFKYKDATACINYQGDTVAQAPITHDTIPARGKHNITTSVEIIGYKLVFNPNFWADIGAGSLNFTSTTTLHGKVTALKILKMSATAYSTCYISVFVQSQTMDSECSSKIKL